MYKILSMPVVRAYGLAAKMAVMQRVLWQRLKVGLRKWEFDFFLFDPIKFISVSRLMEMVN